MPPIFAYPGFSVAFRGNLETGNGAKQLRPQRGFIFRAPRKMKRKFIANLRRDAPSRCALNSRLALKCPPIFVYPGFAVAFRGNLSTRNGAKTLRPLSAFIFRAPRKTKRNFSSNLRRNAPSRCALNIHLALKWLQFSVIRVFTRV